MKVLISPDKFKGSLRAIEVAEAMRVAIRTQYPDAEIVCLPIADGGDGTVEAAVAAGYARVPVTISGPTGAKVNSAIALSGKEAVIELADTCGMSRLPQGTLHPSAASSYGLGEAIIAAYDNGARDIVLGLGGSASTDGGLGMVQALGGAVLDAEGKEVGRGAAALGDIASISLRNLHAVVNAARFTVACDVDNPLLGPNGSAAVYGPQKGFVPGKIAGLERDLQNWVTQLNIATGTAFESAPGAGAAGGVGYAARSLLKSVSRPGVDVVLELIGFAKHLEGADLVVTGEGSLDRQTLSGKAVAGVAASAQAAGAKVVVVAGRISLSHTELSKLGVANAMSLASIEPDKRRSMDQAWDLVQEVTRDLVTAAGPHQTHLVGPAS